MVFTAPNVIQGVFVGVVSLYAISDCVSSIKNEYPSQNSTIKKVLCVVKNIFLSIAISAFVFLVTWLVRTNCLALLIVCSSFIILALLQKVLMKKPQDGQNFSALFAGTNKPSTTSVPSK